MNTYWTWLIMGLVPYYFYNQRERDGYIFEVRALFWSLVILQKGKQHQCMIHIPLIEHLRR